MSSSLIAVSHVFKSVTDATGTLDILRDIDFSLNARQTLAIVGASGSGKSTLLAIMAGLDTPTQGTVHIAGQDLFVLNEDQRAALRAKHIGFVFQSFQLLAPLTALENVMLPLELSGHPSPKPVAKEMLARVGLSERLNHYPKVMSGGEQQRVALARAFVVKPDVLLADEPTGNLDSRTSIEIMGIFQKLNDEGMTVVMVTHELDIAHYCKRIVVMRDGLVRSDAPVTARLNALEELQKLEAEQKAVQLNP